MCVKESADADAAQKVAEFSHMRRGGHVYTIAVNNTKVGTLIPIIACKVQPDRIDYTNSYRFYNVLDITDFLHMRINHSMLFADRDNHVNGIENFWNQAKRHLRKYNGIPRQYFHLYLKEYEWRCNYRAADQLLKTLREWLKPYAKSSNS